MASVARRWTNCTESRLWRLPACIAGTKLCGLRSGLAKLPLAHQPGEVWEYGLCVDILGRVIEVASGQPFDQFLETRLFKPLGMVDTGFQVPEAKLSRLVDPPAISGPPTA